MELIQSKSLLAKLMATENLVVEQRNVRTASFDTKNRVLTIPVLDEKISGYLYDLFMGHEVGHALYTPQDGLKQAWELKLPQSITNVIEDVRIEKKIKNKYPGIRASFVKGYRELVEKDFFGTNGADLNDMNFIDRVNLYSKGGAAQGIRFDKEIEKQLLNKIESTETYDDVIRVSYEVLDYLKQEKEERKQNQPEFEEDEDGDFEIEIDGFDSDDFDDSEDWNDDDEKEEIKSKSNDSDSEPTDEDVENEEQRESGGSSPEGTNNHDLKSYTDEAFRQNESKLFSSKNKTHYYGNIPEFDLSKAILPHKKVWARYREDCTQRSTNWNSDFTGLDTKKFMKLRNDSKKIVGYLAKEFELRKNADQLKRASIAKTGDLNMSKIYAYQLTDDIFKKITVLPGGKSHGLVMFLDWSGSMHTHLENTVKQLINLVMFCKKVNIPYEVYAFTSEYDDPYSHTPKEGDIETRQFKLFNLLSSKMSASEFTYAGSALCQMTEYRRGYRPYWMNLGGTPLSEAILSAMQIVPQFQKQYKLQIVNTVFLTDGDGHSLNTVVYKDDKNILRSGTSNKELSYGSEDYRTERQMVIRDPLNKHQEVVENNHGRKLTSAYIKMLKARTNSNIVGFYVLSGREFGREAYNFFPNYAMHDKLKSEFRKNKCITVTSAGYDEYYLLRSEGLDTDDDVEFTVKENATTRGLVSAFSKYTSNRLSNRVVLNRFIGMIS
jgi:hypothetical protein